MRIFFTSWVVALTALVAPGARATESGPWVEPFADAARTREAASKIPADTEEGVVVFFEDSTLTFDAEGRLTRGFRLIYRIDGEQAIRGWSAVSKRWKPWHQERPILEARVLSPDGGEAWLDPANLAEYNDDESGPDVYADTKIYKGPLPALKVGAIVEERHLVRDTAPGFDAGGVFGFRFGRGVPVRATRMTLDAPAELPLRHKLYLLPAATETTSEKDGRKVTVIEHGPLEAQDDFESWGPGDVPRYPLVRVSTAPSWQAVAARYHELVEGRLEGADLRKLAKKAVGREKDRKKTIDLLLAEVQDRVRYTGIEFGEQAIVPTGPAQTLERGFGDCKDKATLLVALLREAGIPAYVALLDSGTGFDIDPELPGMGLFDHAIVHVPAADDGSGPEIWIDPTHPYARAGELPATDQRRLALVARPDTTAPVMTPVAAPADNRRVQRREVFLAPEGDGRVVETTWVHGEFERSYRHNYSTRTESDLREILERYVKGQYMAESLVEMQISDVEDLSGPLEIRLEADEVRRASTAPTEANVYIPTGALFSAMPAETRPGDDDEEYEPRKSPLLLTQPYVEEWEYVIHPPPGYEVQSTPEDAVTDIGPAKLTQQFAINDDGTVSAKVTFDTVKNVYTPEEVTAIREAIGTIYEGNALTVTFRGIGETLLEAGNIKEALIEFQRLSDAFPDEPVHHTQKARAYLAAGLGEEARREARRAVELAPDSFVAHVVRGRILAHDILGRKFTPGFDRAGAEKALRRAIELDPESFEAHGELAILLEHDDEGRRYSPDARLDEAIAEYQWIRSELEMENLTTNLMVAMAQVGRWEDLRTLTGEAPRNASRDGLRVAAFAVLDGVPAAIEEAKKLTGSADAYRGALINASDWLIATRIYGPAADLMTAGSRGTSESVQRLTQASHLRKLVRHEDIEVDPGSPEGVARAVVRDLVHSEERVRRVVDQLPAAVLEHIDRDELIEHMLELRRSVLWSLEQEGLSLDQTLDTLLSPGSLRVASAAGGEADGWRIRFSDPAGGQPWLVVYAMRDGDAVRAVGVRDLISTVAEWILHLEAQGKLGAARQWLDWVREDLAGEPGPDPLAEHPIRRLWQPDGARDALRVRLAAAALMAPPFAGPRQLELLQAGDRDELTAEERTGLDLALVAAAESEEDHELVLEVSTRLGEAYPKSLAAFLGRSNALMQLERYEEADEYIAARLAAHPDDPVVRAVQTDLPGAKQDLKEWRKRLTAAVATGSAHAGTYNNLAWLDIVEHDIDEETLQIAQESVVRSEYGNAAALHTLATVFAEMGYVAEARDVVLALLNNRDVGELESPDWYILGRIAEEYGALQSARDSYARIDEPEEPDPSSTHSLAVHRLRLMDGAKEK